MDKLFKASMVLAIIILLTGLVFADVVANASEEGNDQWNIFSYTSAGNGNTYVSHTLNGAFDERLNLWDGTVFDDLTVYNVDPGYELVQKRYEYFTWTNTWWKWYFQSTDTITDFDYTSPDPPGPNPYQSISDFEISDPDLLYCIDDFWWMSEKTEKESVLGKDPIDIHKTYSAMCEYNSNADLCVGEICCADPDVICVDDCCSDPEQCYVGNNDGICCDNDEYNGDGKICCPNAQNLLDGGPFGGATPDTAPCSIQTPGGDYDSTCCKDNTWNCVGKNYKPLGAPAFLKATCLRGAPNGGPGVVFFIGTPQYCDTFAGKIYCGQTEEACLLNPLCAEWNVCSTNADCAAGQVCEDGFCRNISSGCTTDADCEAGYYCTADGYCVTTSGCASDADCAPGFFCDIDGFCEDISTCGTDADCEAGYSCIDGACTIDDVCLTDVDCEDGYFCSDDEVCINEHDPKSCDDQSECDSPEECINYICVNPLPEPDPCADNVDCGVDEICTNGICTDKDPDDGEDCTVDSECPPGFSCVNETCALKGCGNGIKEEGEECEKGQLCSIADRPNDIFCNSSCVCEEEPGDIEWGNSIVDIGEECDAAPFWEVAHCQQNCDCENGYELSFPPWTPSGGPANRPGWCVSTNYCGNYAIDNGEECDVVWNGLLEIDPSTFNAINCNPPLTTGQCTCKEGYAPTGLSLWPCRLDDDADTCWDGVLDPDAGEECEAGIACDPDLYPGELFCISCKCESDGLPQNSILDHKGEWENGKIKAEFLCKERTEDATLRVLKDKEIIASYSGIICDDETTTAYLIKTFEKNNLYEIELEIPKLCKVCEREFFLSSTGRGWLNKGDINIPDNNLLLVVLIGFVSFAIIAVKKKEE